MDKYRLFDFHTHIYPDAIADKAVAALNKFYEFECECGGTYAELERTSVEAGAEGFVMLGTATNAHQVEKVNDYVAECVRRGRDKGLCTYGFAAMHQDFGDFGAEIDRVTSLGLSGMKVHPDIQRVNIDDDKLMPLYKACEERKVPVFLHVGDFREEYRYSELRRLDRVINACPGLVIVAAHFGGWSAWDVADAFAGNPNIYYDTSSSFIYSEKEIFERLIEKLGHKKIMFGTDFPCTTSARELERFMKLDIDDAVRRDILYNNAMDFFGRISKGKA
ncbi:MAG: amidohydrolase family protein [Clostridia bacterium]|nr:amidohydrolase family protein [Clostridia bacterium]